MNEKKLQLIDIALRNFAFKGYHATSIQEIVEAAGIAKGSFYFYFKSKEDMLLSALKLNFELLGSKVSTVDPNLHLSERELFCQQLSAHFRQSLKQKDFITILMNEQIIQVNDQMKAFIYQMRDQSLEWLRSSIQMIYGAAINPYSYDAALITQAMCNEYIRLIFSETYILIPDEMAAFIVDRLDDVVKGMLQKQPKPLLNERLPLKSLQSDSDDLPPPKGLQELQKLRTAAEHLNFEIKQRDGIFSYLHVLENELLKPVPEPLMIKTILVYLYDLDIIEIKPAILELEKVLLKLKR